MKRGVVVAGLFVVGCGPERPVEVQDWMLRDYSEVAPGIYQTIPRLFRLEFRDDFTMALVNDSQEGESSSMYDWEPTAEDSLRLMPRESTPVPFLPEATASPYTGKILGVETAGALNIIANDGDQTWQYYPGAMCVAYAGNHPKCTTDDAWCWEAYPCEEAR